MIAVPPVTPYTVSEVGFIVATAVFPLLHVPPAVMSLSMVVVFAHNEVTPVIARGSGFTVTVLVAMHPVGSE